MKKSFIYSFLLLFYCLNFTFAQSIEKGKIINFNLPEFKNLSQRAIQANGLVKQLKANFPLPSGNTTEFTFDESLIGTQKIADIQTFNAVSADNKNILKLTISPERLTGIMHTPEGYFLIETVDFKANLFRIYAMSEGDLHNFQCGVDEVFENSIDKKLREKSTTSEAPFPVGSQLRKLRMAAAATGEFVTFYGNSQATALARIVDVINASNLIYELEAALTFELIPATTNFTILFTNAATDPFTPNATFASATASQTGFTTMNTNSTLLYAAYDVGHTFNVYTSAGISSRGQAGPTPCDDTGKSRAWTEWSSGATMPTYLSMVVGVFVHEVGHQFSAPHTYNAVGGTGAGNPANTTFCTGGWASTSAIEPGSGSTLMGYGNNCVNPTNYSLTGNNNLQYFHTKSLEFIYGAINSAACKTQTATINTPPVANAGVDITIPKGTPFMLNGTATDANNTDALSYTWEQYDVASADDKGAFGGSVMGATNLYTAVNSTASAPLFRSEQSTLTTSRTFPKINYILNNANNPADNEGEDLPQVARTMKFRFTVRDNRTGGGGVDSDEITVTVASSGPLEVSSFNTAQTIAAGSNQTITWNVNGTNALSANVKILLSIDGGSNFSYVLSNSTANDGTESITIPSNVVATTQGRIKVVAVLNTNAEFFDVNDANITITSSCNAKINYICPENSISAAAGNTAFNLGLSNFVGEKIVGNSKVYTTTTTSITPVINYVNNTFATCQASAWGSEDAVLVKFRVSKTGNYTVSSLSNTNASMVFSVFNSNTTFNCTTFMGGNSYGAIGWAGSRTIALNTCTDYYCVVYLINPATSLTLTISGVGDWYEIQSNPSGFSYTYVAVNDANGQISAQSATSNFTSLAVGNYTVYGLMYANAFNPTTVVNQTISGAYGLGSCILFSTNTKKLTATGVNCASTLSLSSTGTANQQASQNITSTQVINSGSNVTYRAGNSITLSPLTGSGFSAANGSVFKAEIGGCL